MLPVGNARKWAARRSSCRKNEDGVEVICKHPSELCQNDVPLSPRALENCPFPQCAEPLCLPVSSDHTLISTSKTRGLLGTVHSADGRSVLKASNGHILPKQDSETSELQEETCLSHRSVCTVNKSFVNSDSPFPFQGLGLICKTNPTSF